MKIAVTGHTKGIGLSIYNYFADQGHEVIGFSRSSGYDISSPFSREKIAKAIKEYDVFVNNVYSSDGSQLSMLKKIFNLWNGEDKTIINISSRYTNTKDLYSIHKKTMDDFCSENVYNQPYILNIKPGLVDTTRVKNIENPKMTVEEVIKIIDWALGQPIKIHSISFGK